MGWEDILGMLGGGMGGMGGGGGGKSGGSGGGGDTTKASMMGFQVPSMSGFGAKANEQNEANRLQLLKNLAPSGGGGNSSQQQATRQGATVSDLLKNILSQGGSQDSVSGGNPYASKTGFMSDDYEPMSNPNLGNYDNSGLPKKNYGLNLGNQSDTFDNY